MKALSGRQPWWWAILHAGKRIENRRWNTHYRGPILLHAAKGTTRREVIEALDWMMGAGLIGYESWIGINRVERGGICGRARLVDVIAPETLYRVAQAQAGRHGADLRWWMPEQYGFILADVQPLPFVPCKGALGLFEVPD